MVDNDDNDDGYDDDVDDVDDDNDIDDNATQRKFHISIRISQRVLPKYSNYNGPGFVQ